MYTLSNADGPLEQRSGPQEIIPENRAVQKHAGGVISPDRGSSVRSELSPVNDDDDDDDDDENAALLVILFIRLFFLPGSLSSSPQKAWIRPWLYNLNSFC